MEAVWGSRLVIWARQTWNYRNRLFAPLSRTSGSSKKINKKCSEVIAPFETKNERLHKALERLPALLLSHERQPTEVFSPWLRVLITAPRSCRAHHLLGVLTLARVVGIHAPKGDYGPDMNGRLFLWVLFLYSRLNLAAWSDRFACGLRWGPWDSKGVF